MCKEKIHINIECFIEIKYNYLHCKMISINLAFITFSNWIKAFWKENKLTKEF